VDVHDGSADRLLSEKVRPEAMYRAHKAHRLGFLLTLAIGATAYLIAYRFIGHWAMALYAVVIPLIASPIRTYINRRLSEAERVVDLARRRK
jgi:predicted PurR-regulated permease PerM